MVHMSRSIKRVYVMCVCLCLCVCVCVCSQAEQLRQHYMTKSNSEVSEAQQNLQPVLQNIKELKRKVT